MARIAGVNLPNQKRLEVGLTYIYGIGRSTALKVCTAGVARRWFLLTLAIAGSLVWQDCCSPWSCPGTSCVPS